jgi:hypothetical protein
MEDGTARTIKEYYDTFIEPHLPRNVNNVIAWHKVLKEYVHKPDAVLGLRTGNVAGYLRRGWETVSTDGYSFFYADNFCAHYYYKLAYDADWEPNLDEFYRIMKNKQFPVRFPYFMDKEEKKRASFIVNGRNPGLGGAGYYLAHIIDAGDKCVFNGRKIGMADIVNEYFGLGEVADWTLDEATQKYCRTNFDISQDKKANARKLAEICFLRMVHPMNYYLSPKSKIKGKIYNEYERNGQIKNNISDDPNVTSYVRQQLHSRYTVDGTDYFQEFLDLVNPVDDEIHEDGNTVINIRYSASPLNVLQQQNNVRPANRIPRVARNNEPPAANNMNKARAIALFQEHEYDFDETPTFASINSGPDVYWMNPGVSVLENNWNIILNDTYARKLHLLVVPANAINLNQVSTKAGNASKLHIELVSDTLVDRKGPSHLSFEQWFMHSIDY